MRRLALLIVVGLLCGEASAASRCREGARRCLPPGASSSKALFKLLTGGPTAGQICAGSLSGITVSRASTSTCTKADGTLAALSSNQLVVEPTGILVQPSTTNLALQSEVFGVTTYTKYNVTLVSNSTDVTDIYGTGNTAERLDLAAITATGQDTGMYQQISTVSPGAGAYSLSVSVRTLSGTGSTYLYMQDGTNLKGSVLINPTATWQRFCLANVTLASSATNFFHMGVERAVAGGFSAAMANQPAQTVYAEGFQVEKGSTCTAYIPTTTTATTRAADVVSTTPYALGATPSIGVTATLNAAPASDEELLQNYNNGSGARFEMSVRSSDKKVQCTNATTIAASSAAVVVGTPFRASCTYTGTQYKVCLNGTCTSATGAYAAPTFTVLNFGNASTSALALHSGWLSDICVNNKANTCL